MTINSKEPPKKKTKPGPKEKRFKIERMRWRRGPGSLLREGNLALFSDRNRIGDQPGSG
jgi:hypothetical protein